MPTGGVGMDSQVPDIGLKHSRWMRPVGKEPYRGSVRLSFFSSQCRKAFDRQELTGRAGKMRHRDRPRTVCHRLAYPSDELVVGKRMALSVGKRNEFYNDPIPFFTGQPGDRISGVLLIR